MAKAVPEHRASSQDDATPAEFPPHYLATESATAPFSEPPQKHTRQTAATAPHCGWRGLPLLAMPTEIAPLDLEQL
eukprot:CAMPEP_0178373102 /NCGR_PEP_ID=MMETSP0689_2-20121128/1692_1 /TAXON_ID=160604 /ORGANISM="Amphidinium massartii, Strain CS-259" /LENGTH=75 /DNA_ID=CAMNT_0019993039 /DNA_START=269 /DNA_END=496 /DNA_ORIENTATION=-